MEYEMILIYGGIIGAVISLVVSIGVFITYDIPQVLRDLRGYTMSNLVKDLAQREETNQKPVTGEIVVRKPVADSLLPLAESGSTTALEPNGNHTTLLGTADRSLETTALSVENPDSNATTQLNHSFIKEMELIIIHSDEVI